MCVCLSEQLLLLFLFTLPPSPSSWFRGAPLGFAVASWKHFRSALCSCGVLEEWRAGVRKWKGQGTRSCPPVRPRSAPAQHPVLLMCVLAGAIRDGRREVLLGERVERAVCSGVHHHRPSPPPAQECVNPSGTQTHTQTHLHGPGTQGNLSSFSTGNDQLTRRRSSNKFKVHQPPWFLAAGECREGEVS